MPIILVMPSIMWMFISQYFLSLANHASHSINFGNMHENIFLSIGKKFSVFDWHDWHEASDFDSTY